MLMKTKKIFPGWLVVLGGLLIMVTIGGVAWNCVSQYIKPVCADLGFSRRKRRSRIPGRVKENDGRRKPPRRMREAYRLSGQNA